MREIVLSPEQGVETDAEFYALALIVVPEDISSFEVTAWACKRMDLDTERYFEWQRGYRDRKEAADERTLRLYQR